MEIERILDEIDMLKPVSPMASKAMAMLYNPDSTMREIVDVIKYDQSMTANLLKICNSSFFGPIQRISSVRQAVAYMGTEKVASLIVMGHSASNFAAAQSGYDLEEGELWRYSVSSALIAQDIAEKKHIKNTPHLFTSALLKDIGKVVLNAHVKDALGRIITHVQDDGLSFIEAEKKVVGIDHAELGAKIAERWNFSPEMRDIIRYHHDPKSAGTDDVSVDVVYLADTICMMIGIGVGSDGLAYRYYQDIVDRLRITENDFQNIIVDFRVKLTSVEELIDLSGGNN
ncbi:MAG: HDOD domain-containing protein [Desulfobacterales bacterium]